MPGPAPRPRASSACAPCPRLSPRPPPPPPPPGGPPPPQPPLTPAPHPAAAATLTGDYLLMLVAMTFNVGLFAAVIAGFAAGALLFGHNAQRAVAGGALLGPRDAPCCSNT
jgi:hypothetical protein